MQQCSEHHTLHKIWIKRSDFRDVVFSAVMADQIPILSLRVRAVPQRNMPACHSPPALPPRAFLFLQRRFWQPPSVLLNIRLFERSSILIRSKCAAAEAVKKVCFSCRAGGFCRTKASP